MSGSAAGDLQAISSSGALTWLHCIEMLELIAQICTEAM